MQALVSIIIPTYRRPRECRAAVESALAQTWRPIEVVVVSDGRDDVTRQAVATADSRVVYVELPENRGPAAARNAGVTASHGEWLCFLDDDDVMLPGKVEAQMRFADPGSPLQMVACRLTYRHDGRDDVWPERPIGADEDLADYILRRPSLLGRPGIVAIQSLLVHRSVVERLPFSSHSDHEDWSWLLEAWHRLEARVVFAWEPLVIYNIAADAVSRSRRVNWADSLAWARRHRRWIGDRAFCSFLATKVALKAKRAADWQGLREIAGELIRSNPGLLELIFLLGTTLMPQTVLQHAWRRSLRAPKDRVAGAEMKPTPAA